MGAPMAAQLALQALPAILGAFSSKFTQQKDTTPKFQRRLIDQVLQGLQGQGPLAGQFGTDMGAFKTSVAEPLQNIFSQQIAPQLQQRAIASGQARGTPLESQLARAGVNVQDTINQLFLPFQQGAQNRANQAIQTLLGFSPSQQTGLTPLGGALAGFSSSGGFQNLFDIFNKPGSSPSGSAGTQFSPQITGGSQLPAFSFNPAAPSGAFGLPQFQTTRKGFVS